MKRLIFMMLCILIVGTISYAQSGEEDIVITSDNATQITQLHLWESDTPAIPLADFSPNGQVIALMLHDGEIKLLSTETFEVIDIIPNIEFVGDNLRFSHDGERLLVSRQDGVYSLWEVNNGEYNLISNVTEPIENSIFIASKNLQYFYTWNSDRDLSISDLITREEIIKIAEVEHFALSDSDNKIITSDLNKIITVWDFVTDDPVVIMEIQNEMSGTDLGGFGFTPSGEIWVNWQQFTETGSTRTSSSTITIYDVTTGIGNVLIEGEHLYHRLYFAPAQNTIVAIGTDVFNSNGLITSWDLDSLEENIILEGDARGRPLEFSPQGDIYVVSLSNNQIRVYDTLNNTLLNSLFVNDTYSHLKFSKNGTLLLNVGLDIRVWSIPKTD